MSRAIAARAHTFGRGALSIAMFAGAAAPLAAQPAPAHWTATWAASMQPAPPRPPADSVDRVPTFANVTLRQVVRLSLGGERVRVRLSNEYGDRPLVIGTAHVGLRGPDGGATLAVGSGRELTFGGRKGAILRPGATMTSDPVSLTVPALADLVVSLYVADSVRSDTRHSLGLQTTYVSPAGDHTAAASFAPARTLRAWLWLAGVDVVNPAATGAIVAIGNSITDGSGSTADANARWPNVLAARLLGAAGEPPKAVVNAGISGNGVVTPLSGRVAIGRFERDVLMQPGVTHVIVLEGINDILRGTGTSDPRDQVSADELIAGLRQLADRAHERGLVVYGATLTPIGGLQRGGGAAEAKRQAVNRWIRSGGAFDGVIDFDRVTRDPADTLRFLTAYDVGDHLHPGDAGYRAMGEAIDLALFRRGAAAGAAASSLTRAAADTLVPWGGYKGTFNNDDQSHADFCVPLRGARVELRYADGSPSGYQLTPALLQPAAGNGVSCPNAALARLDAREIVRDAQGRPMLFHRGGWGFAGNDPESAVHYGHVRLSDLAATGQRYFRPDTGSYWASAPTEPWAGLGQVRGNGTACASLEPTPLHVAVHSIPDDMRYLSSARTAAIRYTIYGSPSEDLGPAADRARGVKYTMLEWSWINVRGGGVARAIVPDGAAFRRCGDVPAIRLAAVADAETQRRTGWVEAVYGAIRAGDGSPLFGWIVSAHQHGSEAVVRHLVP